MFQEDNIVRRTDLRLRTEIYGLKTEIYKVSDHKYQIVCLNASDLGYQDFKKLTTLFNHKVCPVTCWISLVQDIPGKYQYKMESISLDNPVYGFKYTAITLPDLEELLNENFPDVVVTDIKTNPGVDYNIEIYVSSETSDEQVESMKSRLAELDIATDDIRVMKSDAKPIKKSRDNNIDNPFIDRLAIHINKDYALSLVETDYWLENAEEIYEGKIKRVTMPHYRANQKKCFIDASMFDCADIRKPLLLYDTVYLGMPLGGHFQDFLAKQNISENELLDLCDRGKLVIVLTSDEKRYDKKFIKNVYANSPLNIIGQRGINTLLASYIVDLDERFNYNYPKIGNVINELYKIGIKNNNSAILRGDRFDIELAKTNMKFGLPKDEEERASRMALILADALSWPDWARTQSFDILNHCGPLKICNFGVNQLILEHSKLIENEQLREDLQFASVVNAPQIHIAMSLNSTYIPYFQADTGYSDYWLATSLEKFLSFYWYGIQDIGKIDNTTEQAISALKLFDTKIPITKIAEAADEFHTPEKFGDLINGLTALSEQDRKEKVRFFNEMLYDIEKPSKENHYVEWGLTGAGFLPLSYGAGVALNIFSILLGKITGSEIAEEKKKKKAISKAIRNSGREKADAKDVDDIYILDKINRVVSLKTS